MPPLAAPNARQVESTHENGEHGSNPAATGDTTPERDQRTPRNAAFSFISFARDGDWDEAARLLAEPDGGWPEGEDPERIARALKTVLDDRMWLDFGEIPDTSAAGDGQPRSVTLGEIRVGDQRMDVSLAERDAEWRFAPWTVQAVPSVSRALGSWWVSALPNFLVDVRLAEIELWQWVGLAAIAGLGALVGYLASRLIAHGARFGAERGFAGVASSLAALAAPAGVLLSLVAMQSVQHALILSQPARANLSLGTRAATAFIVAWAVVRWIRAASVALEERLVARGVGEGIAIVRVGRSVVSVLVYLLGISAALQIFGLDLSAVIAGLGIGTAALALASQQTLANLFGGASVLADRVLKAGDLVSIGGQLATVERIGIRSTQLRTPDRTVLVVANSDLAQSRVEKLSARDGFRHSAVLGVRYETSPASMRAIIAAIRARLAAEPLVDPASVRVHFLAFGASSLDIDIKATIRTTDGAVYRETVERLNLDFMDIVAANGSGFAFPSQTLYLARDGAPRSPGKT